MSQMYNLTENQKTVLKELVKDVKDKNLDEEFTIYWVSQNLGEKISTMAAFENYRGSSPEVQNVTETTLNIFIKNDFLEGIVNNKKGIYCLKGKAYEAVDTDFHAPDTSFLKHLVPLNDISSFDEELKNRCLVLLGSGGSNPKVWDSAVRTAAVVLEDRLRDVGYILDPEKAGRKIVNAIFTEKGTLASKFTDKDELGSYRELYSGILGVFRNPSAHGLVNPSPEEGGAFIVFVNLLLKKLEALR